MAAPRDQFIRRQREASVDHDLLIAIGVKLDMLSGEMASLKLDIINRVSALEAVSARKTELTEHVIQDKTQLSDHESRLRRLEWWGALGIGGLTLAEIFLNYFHPGLPK